MNPKSNIAMNLLTALGVFAPSGLPQAPGLPDFLGVHTNPKRNRARKLCRDVGHRQARRLTRKAYALKRAGIAA